VFAAGLNSNRQSDLKHSERLPRVPKRYATRYGYACAMTLAALPFSLIIATWIAIGAVNEGYDWPRTVIFPLMVFITLVPTWVSGMLFWPKGSRSRRRMKWTGLGETLSAVCLGSCLLGVLMVIADSTRSSWMEVLILAPLAGITGPFFVNFLTLGLHWPAGIVTSLLFRDPAV